MKRKGWVRFKWCPQQEGRIPVQECPTLQRGNHHGVRPLVCCAFGRAITLGVASMMPLLVNSNFGVGLRQAVPAQSIPFTLT